MAETPHFAHLIVLLFLCSVFVAFCAVVGTVVAAIAGRQKAVRLAAGVAVLSVSGYASLLLVVGIASRSKTLPPGGWKYFCEADCHIAYAIDGVYEAPTLGPEAKPQAPRGRFVMVRVKSWFDQNSTAPSRGNSPLTPNPRTLELLDDTGHGYSPLSEVPAVVEAGSVALTTPLRPGESYATTFVFALPAAAKNLRLLISDSDPVTYLLIDHENSPLHGKIYLALETPTQSGRETTP